MASVISMKALLESGVHFGHRTNKWNPAMKPYIFTERNGIHIIDLQQTVKSLTTAYNLVRDTVMQGGTVLFVGTKRQAQETIQEEATRCGMPYVTERWLGGTLTNWATIYLRIQEMERLERMRDSGEIGRLTKKEGLMIEREINRLYTRLSGIRSMKRLPEMLFIVDVSRELTAIHEANLKELPIVAMVDTNCDPRGIDYVIPSNDDAIRAIKLLVGKIADAVLEGKAMRKDEDYEGSEDSPEGMARAAAARRVQFEEEVEVDDKELLGDSTLAKLVVKTVESDEAEGVAEEVTEEIAEEVEGKAESVGETKDIPDPELVAEELSSAVNDAADADEDLDVAVVEEEVQKPDNNVEDLESNEAD